MRVEVAYARPDCQRLVRVDIGAGATADDAVTASGLRAAFPELATSELDLGIFAQPCSPATVLRPGDRVEIYRPLQIDPKEARRRRAR